MRSVLLLCTFIICATINEAVEKIYNFDIPDWDKGTMEVLGWFFMAFIIVDVVELFKGK
jgi:hypothetical protein